jgi:uroporphyrinogen III methyltransferase/synthase
VVRLKGGDPYVFGRGGEEGEALRAAGIPFEVVPGITAAIGGTCYAGIPVTHRDANSSFTIVTGHEKEEDYQDAAARARGQGAASDLDWSALARLPCLAFYMGVKALPRICAKLMEHGMSPEMPAASIQWGTTPRQRTVVGTVGTLPQKVVEAKLAPPAITIVGRSVLLRDTLNWFETRPLFGQTVLVTRTRQQASELSCRLEEMGARVLEAPTIELSPPTDRAPVDEALRSIGGYDWVVFTSGNGVTYTKRRLLELGLDARVFARTKVAVVGAATAEALREHLCLSADLVPGSFVAEALAAELAGRGEVAGKRFLMLRADIARPVLREKLGQGGAAEVRDIAVYESRPAAALPPAVTEAIDRREVTWVTFTSSSTARNLARLLGPDYRKRLEGVKVASIGPVTTATLEELGLSPAVRAEQANVEGLVSRLLSVTPLGGA